MTLLPELTPEERDALERERQREQQAARLDSVLAESMMLQRRALAAMVELERELRRPLDSVRVHDAES